MNDESSTNLNEDQSQDSSSKNLLTSNYHSDLARMKQYWRLKKEATKLAHKKGQDGSFITGNLSLVRSNINSKFEVVKKINTVDDLLASEKHKNPKTKAQPENIDARVPALLKTPVILDFKITNPISSADSSSGESGFESDTMLGNSQNFQHFLHQQTNQIRIDDDRNILSTANFLNLRNSSCGKIYTGNSDDGEIKYENIATGDRFYQEIQAINQIKKKLDEGNFADNTDLQNYYTYLHKSNFLVPDWQKILCRAQTNLFNRQMLNFINNKSGIKILDTRNGHLISGAPINFTTTGFQLALNSENDLNVELKEAYCQTFTQPGDNFCHFKSRIGFM